MSLEPQDLKRNETMTIRVWPRTYKGRQFIDIRTYVVGDDGNLVATKRGVSVPLALWPQFRQMLARVDIALAEAGWVNKEDLKPT